MNDFVDKKIDELFNKLKPELEKFFEVAVEKGINEKIKETDKKMSEYENKKIGDKERDEFLNLSEERRKLVDIRKGMNNPENYADSIYRSWNLNYKMAGDEKFLEILDNFGDCDLTRNVKVGYKDTAGYVEFKLHAGSLVKNVKEFLKGLNLKSVVPKNYWNEHCNCKHREYGYNCECYRHPPVSLEFEETRENGVIVYFLSEQTRKKEKLGGLLGHKENKEMNMKINARLLGREFPDDIHKKLESLGFEGV